MSLAQYSLAAAPYLISLVAVVGGLLWGRTAMNAKNELVSTLEARIKQSEDAHLELIKAKDAQVEMLQSSIEEVRKNKDGQIAALEAWMPTRTAEYLEGLHATYGKMVDGLNNQVKTLHAQSEVVKSGDGNAARRRRENRELQEKIKQLNGRVREAEQRMQDAERLARQLREASIAKPYQPIFSSGGLMTGSLFGAPILSGSIDSTSPHLTSGLYDTSLMDSLGLKGRPWEPSHLSGVISANSVLRGSVGDAASGPTETSAQADSESRPGKSARISKGDKKGDK